MPCACLAPGLGQVSAKVAKRHGKVVPAPQKKRRGGQTSAQHRSSKVEQKTFQNLWCFGLPRGIKRRVGKQNYKNTSNNKNTNKYERTLP
jgi:hypothetical protein